MFLSGLNSWDSSIQMKYRLTQPLVLALCMRIFVRAMDCVTAYSYYTNGLGF